MADAAVLAESFTRHHPEGRFHCLIVDDPEGELAASAPFSTLTPEQVGIERDELHRRATMFNAHGLAVSTKPDLLSHLLNQSQEPVVFLDADSCVYGALDDVGGLAARHSIVVTPTSPDPHPAIHADGAEQMFYRYGIINTGFVAVGPGAEEFLDWWRQRASRRSVDDQTRGLHWEQSWVVVALGIFDHCILRDRGLNVTGWRLRQHDVEWRGNTPYIADDPLRHFHFITGFDPRHPDKLSAAKGIALVWPWLSDRPGTARICAEYAARLIAAGWEEARTRVRRFDSMPDGRPLEPWMREEYRGAVIAATAANREEPPNPFTHGPERFAKWLES